MKHIIGSAFVALALVTAPAIISSPAHAAVDFNVTVGNAAFAYSDGYWDRGHVWHKYRNRAEARYFQEHFPHEHYFAVRHDRDRKDRDQGWRNERWWEEHH